MSTSFIQPESIACLICLEDLTGSVDHVQTCQGKKEQALHNYHKSCLLKWRDQKTSENRPFDCAVCKQEIDIKDIIYPILDQLSPENLRTLTTHLKTQDTGSLPLKLRKTVEAIEKVVNCDPEHIKIFEPRMGSLIDHALKTQNIDLLNDLINKMNLDAVKILLKMMRRKQPCNQKIANFLVSKLKKVNTRDHNKSTLLHRASEHGYTEILTALIDANATINAKNSHGETSVQKAVEYGGIAALKILITKGADINTQNEIGDTPVHTAIKFGRIDALKALINAGADTDIENHKGHIPMVVAENFKQKDSVEALSNAITYE